MCEFETAYKEHVQTVFRYALRRVGRRDWAEDITSESFIALYENRRTVDAAQLPAWLLKVAKHRAIDYWRKWSKEQPFEEEPQTFRTLERITLIPFEQLLDHKSLKPVHRVCLILRFAHGMSRDEIAKETGLHALQVKGHLQYALKLLRKEMGGYRFGAQSEESETRNRFEGNA
jgi:RNA polymerase sigma-70 factor, ECF subfamily